MEERDILELLWQRAEGAIDALALMFGRRLHAMAMNILGNREDAEECVSDTYLAVWNAIPPGRPDSLTGFVCRVGRNTALKRLRANTAEKRCRDYDLSLEELAGCLPGPDFQERLDARGLGRAMDAYLDTLTRESRVLFLRRYWFGDSIPELARELSMTQNSVSVRLSRIRGGLKKYLIQEGYIDGADT